jgi:hypothetical protein
MSSWLPSGHTSRPVSAATNKTRGLGTMLLSVQHASYESVNLLGLLQAAMHVTIQYRSPSTMLSTGSVYAATLAAYDQVSLSAHILQLGGVSFALLMLCNYEKFL